MDINTLVLRKSPFEHISSQELAQQIAGRRKAKTKLPTWYAKKGIYYPPTLNLEQTSSEITASYKSNLVSGDLLIDLTGGFGIDDYFFSKTIKRVVHCEMNLELSTIAAHNFKTLDAHNIHTEMGNGLEILHNHSSIDWIYIDPSRRHDQKGKVFFLEDCLPNVPANLSFLFSKSDHILIKTSPLLDIHSGIKSLQHVKEIHIVAVNNEVKELLWVLDKNVEGKTKIQTSNIQKTHTDSFSFFYEEESSLSVALGMPQTYLYEPNAAILKSGGFLSIAKAYNLEKLHLHSHLYTANQEIPDFPGRGFSIINSYPYQKKTLQSLGIKKANITTRNFPETVATLRKKFKIKEGGDIYLFFTTDLAQKKIVLQCQKL